MPGRRVAGNGKQLVPVGFFSACRSRRTSRRRSARSAPSRRRSRRCSRRRLIEVAVGHRNGGGCAACRACPRAIRSAPIPRRRRRRRRRGGSRCRNPHRQCQDAVPEQARFTPPHQHGLSVSEQMAVLAAQIEKTAPAPTAIAATVMPSNTRSAWLLSNTRSLKVPARPRRHCRRRRDNRPPAPAHCGTHPISVPSRNRPRHARAGRSGATRRSRRRPARPCGRPSRHERELDSVESRSLDAIAHRLQQRHPAAGRHRAGCRRGGHCRPRRTVGGHSARGTSPPDQLAELVDARLVKGEE